MNSCILIIQENAGLGSKEVYRNYILIGMCRNGLNWTSQPISSIRRVYGEDL